MDNALITTQDLGKRYDSGEVSTDALAGVSLAIAKGSFTCIIGPSGHGKSTLMHLLGGLDTPSSGTVTMDGVDLGSLSPGQLASLRAEKIGFVFQFFNLLQNLTARENIETALMLAGVPAREHADRARELLEMVGLSHKADALPRQLSGGQQQRVAIARALANDPDILLMDEPTGNLDSAAEAEVLAILRTLHQRGKTIILVTHNPDIAAQAEHLIRVHDGRVVH
jgi:putative ABC transport system ATP-binding protein